MKLKSITLATMAALYASGMAAASTDITPVAGINALKQVQLPSVEEQQRTQVNKVEAYSSRVKTNSGKNVQLQRATAADKFKPEEGVSGEQVYIIELYGNTVQDSFAGSRALTQSSQPFGLASVTGLKGEALKSPEAASIERAILEKQDSILSEASSVVGRSLETPLRFTKAINGFTTKMTQDEAMRLASMGAVKSISRRQILELQTDVGPGIIGADKVWTGNTASMMPYMGEGVVVGVIDTGINTDHPSFAPTGDDGYTVENPLGSGNYLGDCAKAEFADRCNDKLIGVFSYEEITDQYSADEFQDPNKPWYDPAVEIRPRFGEDYNGHGSHTASTAAGNVKKNVPFVVPEGAMGDGVPTGYEFPQVSGVAPHANVVAFQVCYSADFVPYAGCASDAIVAAIEDAIDAGVDVINFSIGSPMGSEPWSAPTQKAFLNAHEAGIMVAAAAGNTGTNGSMEIFGYIDNTSPWILTVAASTTGRTLNVEGKTMTGFSGGDTTPPATLMGGSISGEVTGHLVLAEDFGDKLCAQPFPEGTFAADDIVICERGEVPRVAKADNVKAGGAGGFVLYNTNFSSSNPEGKIFDDIYSLPGIHLSARDWTYKLKPWLLSGTDHMATITASEMVRNVDPTQQDILAEFSSRGPAPYNPEHLVPSVTAPGVNIFAANADDQPFTSAPAASDWTIMSGTSMASPHTAGAMALVRDAHPDWTPQQVQSALQMTAEQVVTYKPYSWAQNFLDAGIYRAGSGRINVANAINAGLLMNETAANFRAADPSNGGMPTRLNLPELVNLNCKAPCSWVREVTATEDGTWAISTETDEYSVRLKAMPETFTLKAGETQSVVITADIVDSQSHNGSAEQEVHARVFLSSNNPEVPQIYWPVVFKYDEGSLPSAINLEMNRGSGKHVLSNIMLPQLNDATFTAATPVKGDKQLVTLQQNENNVGGFGNRRVVNDDDFLYMVDVPANSARIVVEVLGLKDSTAPIDLYPMWGGDADIYVGIDLNNDGVPQWEEEAICYSATFGNDEFCNIDNPEAGNYWVVIDNYRGPSYVDRPTDTFEIATAVVSKDAASNLSVTGPSVTDGINPSELTLNWELPESVEGDVYYSALMVGTDANNIANVDTVATRLYRGANEFTIKGSQTQALADQRVSVTLHLKENLDGYDRDFSLDVQIPDNLYLVEDSLKVSRAAAGELAITDSGFSLVGTQESTLHAAPEYKITTSKDDAMCRLPNLGQGEDSKYLDLRQFGFPTQLGGGYQDVFEFDLRSVWGKDGRISLFNNFQYEKTPIVRINPIGYLQLDELPDFFGDNQDLNQPSFPYLPIAPLWRGVHYTDNGLDWGRQYAPLQPNAYSDKDNKGISLAYTAAGMMIVEWDNAYMADASWDYVNKKIVYTSRGDSVDFEVLLNSNYGFGDGEYEMYFAYDNLNWGPTDGFSTIGLKGFVGPRDPYGPTNGPIGAQYLFGDARDKIEDEMVICYDYAGPESSQFDVTFDVLVKTNAAGQPQDIVATLNGTDVEQSELSYSINVPSNLKIGAIKDYTISEDSSLEDVMVAYSDSNTVPNVIKVTGEHITAVVNGNEPGATFDLVPEADFFGQTEVTVTVSDANNPGDAVSTSFILTVTPEADAPVAKVSDTNLTITEGDTLTLDASASMDPDGDSLTFTWEGDGNIADSAAAVTQVTGLATGNHTFTVTVSDGDETASAEVAVKVVAKASPAEPAAPADKDGGGALGWLALLLMPLAALRRRSR
ncbi:S8 family serine peptidase [Shewanella amazonensis]|uniref:Serine protease, subtilase family n=1 Tax=Shewanella amazonensis (strain ATCC BAA-1098 / SB2B) TaxID=326297 RepID=A1S942_SHEAM|nr:S8 family serine peptidase [Shewanella amazonensis]ABM00899.1 serine protease, subtilase family [Shewanella amazonensis SB2B]